MKVVNHITNIILSVALLIATTGFTLNKHYCMGRLKSVAINAHAANCANGDQKEQMPCCKDVSQELKINDITQVSFDFDSRPDLFQIAAIQNILLNKTLLKEEERPHPKYYPPPLAALDFQAVSQVFLI